MFTLREGDRISTYRLEARIGRGSFGEVWRARHHIFNEVVAIKIPTEVQFVRNLQREGVTVHGLRHPNIVRAIDLDPYADPPFLVMEYVEGPSIRTAIDTLRAGFPIGGAVAVLRGVLQALQAAHAAGVIHRDLKPANILLSHPLERIDSITPQAVKVTDFGLGQAGGMTAQSMLQSGSMDAESGRSLTGTIAYMSPEQREGQPLDARSDLYACGIILFEMLTGERPQGGEAPSSVRPEVPAILDDVFRRCYARLDRRFSGAADALRVLAAAGNSQALVPKMHGAGDPERSVGDWCGTTNLSEGEDDDEDRRPVPPPVPGFGLGRCPQCGGQTERDDQFCISCGRQLVNHVPQCPSCAGYIHVNDRFCIYCGKDLRVLGP